MSEQAETHDTHRDIPTAQLIPLPASWIDDLTLHCQQVKTIRLLFARSTRDELTAPKGLDDFQVRLMGMDRPDGQGTMQAFDIAGFPKPFLGPRPLCEFLWDEGQEHYRACCLEADADGKQRPRRLRFVARLLDDTGGEIADLGGYTGMAPRSAASRRAAAAGVAFASDYVEENPVQVGGMGRVNASLENGYIRMVKRVEAGLDQRAKDLDMYARNTYERANDYHERVANSSEDGDDDDEMLIAAMGLAQTIFGEKNKRNEKADDINSRAPKDNGKGGPACAYARAALEHFTPDVIRNCREQLGAQPVDRMLQTLRMATESDCDDKALLVKFRQSAEWFVKQAQQSPEARAKLMYIPKAAAPHLDALMKLSFA